MAYTDLVWFECVHVCACMVACLWMCVCMHVAVCMICMCDVSVHVHACV